MDGMVRTILQFLTEPRHFPAVYGICAAVYMLREYVRRKKHRLLAFLFGTGSGIAGLLLLHVFGEQWGLALPLTVFHLAVAAVAGLPGVLLLIWLFRMQI